MECVVPIATRSMKPTVRGAPTLGHLIPQIPSQCSPMRGDSSLGDFMPMTSDDIRWHFPWNWGGSTWLACSIDIESSKIRIWMNLAPLKHPFASHESSSAPRRSAEQHWPWYTSSRCTPMAWEWCSFSYDMMIGYECIILFYSIILWWLW